jgi:GNAT superfamily N-acetyltransferase
LLKIRVASSPDRAGIWSILEPVIRAGETYALPCNMSEADALTYWCAPTNEVFVAEEAGQILGTYLLRANALGGGSHVANCGYMTSPVAQGRGIARRMLEHSLEWAKARGFRAMQFNFVVSTNERAIKAWQKTGFEVVGRLPGAFNHPKLGFVDALVMFRTL